MLNEVVIISDIGGGIVKVEIPYFNICTYIRYEFLDSYLSLWKLFYRGVKYA